MTPTEQRAGALAKANAVRLGRARLKYAVRRGELELAPILLGEVDDDVVELTENVPVVEMLQWQNRWGRIRARKALMLLGVPDHVLESVRLSHLSSSRRFALVGLLEVDAKAAA